VSWSRRFARPITLPNGLKDSIAWLAKEGAALDVVQQYHSDLAQRLSDEAALIPRRTAIVERLHEREQQIKDDSA
jgi:hypothetical protein